MAKSYLDKTGLALVWEKIKNLMLGKVDKVEGKGLSTNDYTDAEKTKLTNIEANAQVNVLEGIQKNGDTVTITNKIANISVPTKTSDITNDSGFITTASVPVASSTTPKMDGTAAVGTGTTWARADHVHPSDSTKVDKVSGKGLSTNDYTTAEKNKLAGIAAGAEVNQNAFSNVKVGTTTIIADDKTDTLELAGGDNVTLTPDASGGKVTISASHPTFTAVTGSPSSDQTPSFGSTFAISQVAQSTTGQVSVTNRTVKIPNATATTSAAGLMSASDKTKLNGIETGAEVNQDAFSNIKVGSTTVAADSKTDTLELIGGDNVTITPDATNGKITITAADTTYSNAVANGAAGLMSGTDKAKLDGIATGAEVNQNAFSNVKVGTTTIEADGKMDTLTFVAGSDKVSIVANASTDTITIDATGAVTGVKGNAESDYRTGDVNITKANIGLGNVDNTSDANKPISTATQTALNAKADKTATVSTVTYDTTNKKITKTINGTTTDVVSVATIKSDLALTQSDVGLGNVDNTADADKEVLSATKLKNARTIDGVSFNGTANIIHYGTCSTTASTTTKAVSCTGFTLATGARIVVKFTVTNTGAVGSLKLNVNSTGEKPIKYRGGNLPSAGTLEAKRVYEFVYDGTNYELISDLDTTYTAATANPLMDGTVAIGTSTLYARQDHVHPTDTSRVSTSTTVNGHALSSNITLTPSDVSAVAVADVGVANGVCPLNASSKIDSTYLPSFVDDVIEAYARSGQTALSSTWLATGSASGTVITPQTGVIYVLMADSGTDYSANSQFRWSGSSYVKLNDGGVSPITATEINAICV